MLQLQRNDRFSPHCEGVGAPAIAVETTEATWCRRAASEGPRSLPSDGAIARRQRRRRRCDHGQGTGPALPGNASMPRPALPTTADDGRRGELRPHSSRPTGNGLFRRRQTRTKLYAYNAQQAPAQDHCTTTSRPPHLFRCLRVGQFGAAIFTATLRSAAASNENSIRSDSHPEP